MLTHFIISDSYLRDWSGKKRDPMARVYSRILSQILLSVFNFYEQYIMY